MRYYGVQNEVKAYCNRLQSETSITVTPSLVKTLNDRVESLKKSGVWSQFGLGFNDNDGDEYLQRASVTDILGRSEVLWFVRGMKSLGLWQNMVCWPLRSYQNAGTGSTVYSLGGLGVFDGTMINSPTWGVDGITCVENGPGSFGPDSTQHITSAFFFQRTIKGALIVTNPVYGTLTDGRFFSPPSTLSIDGYAGSNAYRALFGTTTIFGNGQRIGGTWDFVGFGTGGLNWFGCNETYTQTGTNVSGNQTVGFYPVGEVNNAAIATSAFTIAFDGLQMSGNVYQALRNLYKQTLGSNLSLP